MTDDMVLALITLAFALGAYTSCFVGHMVFRRRKS